MTRSKLVGKLWSEQLQSDRHPVTGEWLNPMVDPPSADRTFRKSDNDRRTMGAAVLEAAQSPSSGTAIVPAGLRRRTLMNEFPHLSDPHNRHNDFPGVGSLAMFEEE